MRPISTISNVVDEPVTDEDILYQISTSEVTPVNKST